MNTILTDDEIDNAQKAWIAKGMCGPRPFARAIEAAVLAKLREQEPVAWWVTLPSGEIDWSDEPIQHKEERPLDTLIPGCGYQPLYAAPLPAVVQVPQGWKLVPVEPTPEMLMAAQEADMDHQDHEEWLEFEGDDVKRIHRAMLNAAPSPESAAQDTRPKKLKVTLQDTEADRYKRMFEAACSALGEIAEALGIDPEDGGAEPILDAIEELRAAAPEAPARAIARNAPDRMKPWISLHNISDDEFTAFHIGFCCGEQAIPTPWREAVKVMREALREALCEPDRNLEQRPGRRAVIRAALALADALEEGK